MKSSKIVLTNTDKMGAGKFEAWHDLSDLKRKKGKEMGFGMGQVMGLKTTYMQQIS